MKTIKSIKNKFIKGFTPGIGRVTFDINLNIKRHMNEINIAIWLKSQFGGNIKILQEKGIMLNVSQPDYIWNNEYWELKNCSSLESIDTRLRKGIKQLKGRGEKGGIILSINKYVAPDDEIVRKAINRLAITNNIEVKVIIVYDSRIIDILELNEKR